MRPELAAVIGAERFVREIRTVAALQHPHILGLIDSGEVQGTAYYVMPFVEGESLRDRLTREKQLPVADAVRIATEVASALDYAHRHGVIHRDIKPENILLHDGQALVADFGIALAMTQAGGTRITETGMSLGTPHYMSPEQAMGEREITARSDVDALGAVLYEMLSGEPPFTGPTAQAIVAKVMTDEPRPLTIHRKTVPPHVEAAVLSALAKLPADRFETAKQFAEALASPGIAKTTLLPAISRSRAARWPIVVAAGVLGFVGGVAAARLRAPSHPEPATQYVAERLGGAPVSLQPGLSPDGKTVAFAAMEGRQTQVAVLNAETGDWKVLTHDTTLGIAQGFAWAPDGTRIYCHRCSCGATAEPRVCSCSARPDNGKLDTLPAYSEALNGAHLAEVFPGGKEAAFFGGVGPYWATDTLYAIDLATKKTRVLSATIGRFGHTTVAITPDGRAVLVTKMIGDETQIVSIPRDGSDRERVLLRTTSFVDNVAMGPDGSIYLDQMNRPAELVRFAPSTGQLERTPLPPSLYPGVFPLRDGRVLAVQRSAGRTRIATYAPGKDLTDFLGSRATNTFPIASLGSDQVLLRLIDSSGTALVAANASTGSITMRQAELGDQSFAGSPDGKTIFFADSGAIWSVPATGGQRRRLADGSAVATDPGGRYVVTQVIRSDGVHLLHVPLDGGASMRSPYMATRRWPST